MNIKKFLLKRYPTENIDFLWASSFTEIRLACPFCGDDKGFHFYINLRSGRWQCFLCRERGNSVYTFIKKIEPDRYKKILDQYYKKQQTSLLVGIDSSLKKHVQELLEQKSKIEPIKADLTMPFEIKKIIEGKRAWRYLVNRGITPKMIKKYKLSYVLKGKFAFRVIIPFFENKKLVYYLGRTFMNGIPKILNPYKDFDIRGKNEVLFNYDSLKEGGEEGCIVEGVFDCMTVDQILPTVGLCGKTLSKVQLRLLLKKKIKHWYLFLDSETEEESTLLYNKLKGYDFEISLIRIIKDDPNSIGVEECGRLIKKSTTMNFKSYIENQMTLKNKY